jgi:hypothetical protein
MFVIFAFTDRAFTRGRPVPARVREFAKLVVRQFE